MLKLGKKPPTPDHRDITFKAVTAGLPLPSPPSRFGHGLAFKDWQMLGNGPDETVASGFEGCGDCVFAGADHEHMLATKLGTWGKHPASFTGASTVSDYSAVTGYVLGDDSTDQGTEVREALKYRRSTGVIDANGVRHKIGAYVSINPTDWHELMQAVYIFSAVGIGFEFPDSAWQQFDDHLPWDVVDGASIEGGHYVPVFGRNSTSTGGCVSWARRQGFTRDFYEAYNDESWAIVFPEEIRNGMTERGFTLEQLNAALAELA